ncbi:glycosyltransferase family 9 protein [Mycobacterium adipatum]|uniref:glycosyltransferase family 9 protein n=1 Tax=Mycobacterium adipatum TaxID=1682113 RepID=UPI0018D45527|nr:glycosyltransferase family 9 protein [Mycobacterium adipatum]
MAIIQTWGLGDLVMTTPVIAEYRRLYPDSRLTIIVQGRAQAALLDGSPMVDQIIEMPPRENWPAYLRFFFALRRQRIDVAFLGTRIDPSWLLWSLKVLAGIPILIGDGEKSPHLYSIRGRIDPSIHRVDRMLETFALWSGQTPTVASFPLPRAKGLQEARSRLAEAGLGPGRFVVIHPGSSVTAGTDKRIPVDVARRIAQSVLERRPDLSVAFIFGPDEVDYIPSFADLDNRQVILHGLSLSVTVALISEGTGFIGSDSGLGHVAAAFGIPTITVVGPTIASETAPYGDKAKVVRRNEPLACQPCWGTPLYGHCPYEVRCMNELPEADIVEMTATWGTRDR